MQASDRRSYARRGQTHQKLAKILHSVAEPLRRISDHPARLFEHPSLLITALDLRWSRPIYVMTHPVVFIPVLCIVRDELIQFDLLLLLFDYIRFVFLE